MELAELPDAEAAEFRTGPSALDDVVRRLKEALGPFTFFTIGDAEARSWTLRHGQTALDAAESVHSDIARGFIRCEVIRWDDLLECGSHAEAARRGLQRLEGKATPSRTGTSSTFASTSRQRAARGGSRSAGGDERGACERGDPTRALRHIQSFA